MNKDETEKAAQEKLKAAENYCLRFYYEGDCSKQKLCRHDVMCGFYAGAAYATSKCEERINDLREDLGFWKKEAVLHVDAVDQFGKEITALEKRNAELEEIQKNNLSIVLKTQGLNNKLESALSVAVEALETVVDQTIVAHVKTFDIGFGARRSLTQIRSITKPSEEVEK